MLEYNVYFEDASMGKIISRNVFNNSKFYNNLIKIATKYKETQNLDSFKEEIRKELLYTYWGRCEYEVVVTSWPPHVDVEEVDRIKNEIEEHNKNYNWKQLRAGVNLTVGEKISIYDQIMLNFNIFINYILNNLDYIIKG